MGLGYKIQRIKNQKNRTTANKASRI